MPLLFCLGQVVSNGLVAWASFCFLSQFAPHSHQKRLMLTLWLTIQSLLALLMLSGRLPGGFLLQFAALWLLGKFALRIPSGNLIPSVAVLLVCFAFFQGFSALLMILASRQLSLPENGLWFQLLCSALLALLFCLALRELHIAFSGFSDTCCPPSWACLCAILMIRLPLRLDFAFEAHLAQFSLHTWLCALLMLFCGVCLFWHTLQEARQTSLNRAALAQATAQNRHYAAFQHDSSNHLLVLSALLHQQQFRQAVQYAAGLQTASKPELATGIPALDGLLTEKLRQARKMGIQTCWEIQIPADFSIKPVDLCAIFANLCDNSLAACAVLPPDRRHFQLTAKSRGSLLLIEASNPCQIQGFQEGTGIRNLRRIARRYQGTVNIQISDNLFQISLLLSA